MIPKKVRKILSIMIAVALVMAVIPAVAFADEVNTLFGNGDETVASTGDATEAEETAPVENGTEEDEGVAQTPVDDENADASQPVGVALTDNDTDIELANIRSNSGGNLDSLTDIRGLHDAPSGFDESKLKVSITWTDCDIDGTTPVFFTDNSIQSPKITMQYDGASVPEAYKQYVSENYTLYFTISNDDSGPGGYYNTGLLESEYVPGKKGTNSLRIDLDNKNNSTTIDSKSMSFIIQDRPRVVVSFYKNFNGDNEEKVLWLDYGDKIDSIPAFATTPACETQSTTWYTDATCTQPFDLNTKITKKTELYADWTTNHTVTLTRHAKVPATCVATGTVEYWQCSECSRYYSDQAGTEANEIAKADVVIPIDDNAHDWEQPTYQWENDNSAVTASRVCKNDANHIESEVGTVTSEVTQKATCSVTEETTYTATFNNPVFITQTKTVTTGDIVPDAHDWGEVTYKWSKDNSSVTAVRTCKNNISHNETETVSTTKTVTKEATETAPGDILYSAEFSNPAFKKQTKYEEIPAKGSSEKQPEEKKSEEPTADEEAFYINDSGDKITWTVGSTDTLNIKFERSEDNASTSKHFLGIEVDGKATSKELYDTEDGSIIIKLKPALLETLGEGEHTLTALFDDGSASAKFTIIKATKEVKNEKKTTSKNAKTGDASPIKLVIIIMIVSALACAGVLVIKKKRR